MIVLAAFLFWAAAAYVAGMSRPVSVAGFVMLPLAGVLAHLVLPEASPVLGMFGGSLQSWAAVTVLVGIGGAYSFGLAWLKTRAREQRLPERETPKPAFSDVELDRYARHIVLREVGGAGQKRLKAAKVLVVGAGGLGSPALLYLAAAGVGTIGIVDDDSVSNSNLQRQIIHTDARIGQAKVASAELSMRALNPFIQIRTFNARLAAELAAKLFAQFDLILDGSDNFDTRYLVNAAAVAAGKPLISAAITQWEGQIGLYHPAKGGPCYGCLFPEPPAQGLAPSCAEAGVIAPLPGVIGSMMALEAVKQITGAGATLLGQLLIYDSLWGESRKISVERRAACQHCHQQLGSMAP